MSQLQDSLVELIRRTSAEIPDDVHQAILASLENEKKGSLAANAIKIIDQNIALAKQKSQPICQDTGSILFYVDVPVGLRPDHLCRNGAEAVKQARRRVFSGKIRWIRSRARTMARTSGRARRRFIFINIVRRK